MRVGRFGEGERDLARVQVPLNEMAAASACDYFGGAERGQALGVGVECD